MSLNEEDIIKARPLLFESRPFTRITKRIGTLTSSSTAAAATDAASADLLHAEIDLDFTYFHSVLARIQLLCDTNAAEVQRYSGEAGEIQKTAERARDQLVSLRAALETAQQEKAHKQHYDTITYDILNTRGLRPRAEQQASIERLQQEIAELEREREEYRAVWTQRREQFKMIVEQLERMWAQIKEEKDEQDRRDGMSEEEGEEGEEGEVIRSDAGTPAASIDTPADGGLTVPTSKTGDGGSTPVPVEGATPVPGESTPLPMQMEEEETEDAVNLVGAPAASDKGGDKMDTT